MKKASFLFLLFLVAGFSAHAQKQKVTVDDDTIKVDGNKYAVIEKKNGLITDYTIKSLDGKEQIFFKFLEFNDPNAVNSGNPQGRVTYFEVTFLNSGGKCEVSCPATKKAVAKTIVENNLIKNNAVDADAEKNFILINGAKYSERKKELAGPKVII
ncbi:MAG TPA: hypothetical protein VFJ43_17755, partial [Bacteroidia bacterium]|nr:hypothetical protein [Bacteroidia bacterium]